MQMGVQLPLLVGRQASQGALVDTVGRHEMPFEGDPPFRDRFDRGQDRHGSSPVAERSPRTSVCCADSRACTAFSAFEHESAAACVMR